MRYILIVFIISILYSCGAKKGVRYFENIEDKEGVFKHAQSQLVFKPNDLINIRISSSDNVAVAPYNLTETSFVSDDGIGATVTTKPYLVKPDGTINMPTLGKVEVVGKTREELTELIRSKLVPVHLKNPMINIELVNFRVSVLGDVSRPGIFTVDNERITILDAIALAGDMRTTGLRDNVLVLREENGQKRFIRVNFLSDSIFQSPAFFLKQNDVVYVEPNSVKTREASWDTKLPLYFSFLTLGLTIYGILTR